MFCKKDKEIPGYKDFMTMFNGLHLISGDGAAYQKAADWLSSDSDIRIKQEISCITVYAKPSKLLFSGMTGEEYRAKQVEDSLIEPTGDTKSDYKMKLDAVLRNIVTKEELLAMLKSNLKPDELKAVEDDPKSNSMIEDVLKELIILKEEASSLSGAVEREEREEEADTDERPVTKETMDRLLKFVSKPDTEQIGIDTSISRFLPQLKANEKKQWSKEDKVRSYVARRYWKQEFKDVNLSMVRRVALMSLQMRKHGTVQHLTWIKKHNGRPVDARYKANKKNANDIKSRAIFEEQMEAFKEDKKYWKKYSDLFKRRIREIQPIVSRSDRSEASGDDLSD